MKARTERAAVSQGERACMYGLWLQGLRVAAR